MDDFNFSDGQKSHFHSAEGVGSRVTDREGKKNGDKSVTASISEKILLTKFHDEFPRMSIERAKDRGEKTEFEFRLYPSGREVTLAINHPKAEGNETRIYFRKGVFYPSPSDFWFIYEREGTLWIGSLDPLNFDLAAQGQQPDSQNGFDHVNEDSYQSIINGKVPRETSVTKVGYGRNPQLVKKALIICEYTCELTPSFSSFISKYTGNPYLEGHHFVPMFEQRNYSEISIDVPQNICILNPYVHKMLHHATYGEIEAHIKKLAEPREEFLKTLELSVEDVLRIYGGP